MVTYEDVVKLGDMVLVANRHQTEGHVWMKTPAALETLLVLLSGHGWIFTQCQNHEGTAISIWKTVSPEQKDGTLKKLTLVGTWDWPKLRRGTPGMASFILQQVRMPDNPDYWSGTTLNKHCSHIEQSLYNGRALDALVRQFTDITNGEWQAFWRQRFPGDDSALYERGIRHGEVFTREFYKLCGNPLPGQCYTLSEAIPIFLGKFHGKPLTEDLLREAAGMLQEDHAALFVSAAKVTFQLDHTPEEMAAGEQALNTVPTKDREALTLCLNIFRTPTRSHT